MIEKKQVLHYLAFAAAFLAEKMKQDHGVTLDIVWDRGEVSISGKSIYGVLVALNEFCELTKIAVPLNCEQYSRKDYACVSFNSETFRYE